METTSFSDLPYFSTTSNANFANIFIFSESVSTKDHFDDIFSKIHPLLKEIEIAPRK